MSALTLEPVSVAEAVDTGSLIGDGAVEIDSKLEDGRFFITEGHDQAGNGSLGFRGEVAGNSAIVRRSYDGPGLLTFSWWIWASVGERLALHADGEQLFRTSSNGNYGFVQESFRLPEGQGQRLEWKMQYGENPWNPMYLDDIHFSTASDPSLAPALGLPSDTELFTTAPFNGNDAAWAAVVAQAVVTHDGESAVAIDAAPLAQGDPASASERRTITLPITGPAIATFWSRSALPREASFASFVSGERVAQIDGSSDWTETSVAIPVGTQTLRWELITNDADLSEGHTVWLDDVVISQPSGSVPEALDADFLTWSVSGVNVLEGDLFGASGEDAVLLFGGLNNAPGPWVEAKTQGAGVLRFASRGSVGRAGGSAGSIGLNGVLVGGVAAAREWQLHEITLPPGDNAVRVSAGEGAELWLDAFSFAPAREVTIAEALDAPELVFQEGPRSAGTGAWIALGDLGTSFDGDDSLMLDAFPFQGRVADVRTEVEGPARISFKHTQQIEVIVDGASTERRFFASPEGGWTTQHLSIPFGRHRIGWVASGNKIRSRLDSVAVTPVEIDGVPGAALDTGPDRAWIAFGDVPWKVVTGPGETFDGIDALMVDGASGSATFNHLLQTSVDGPAIVRFAARVNGRFSDSENWIFTADLRAAGDNGGYSHSIPLLVGDWRVYDLPVQRGRWTLSFSGSAPSDRSYSIDAVSVTPVELDLAEAVGAPGLVWRTGGDAPWLTQPSVSGPSSVEVVSGQLVPGESSWIETVIEGPAKFQFSWRSFNFNRSDAVSLQIDGEQIASLGNTFGSLTGPWQVGEGPHTIRWEFSQGRLNGPLAVPGAAVVNGFTIVDNFEKWAEARAIPAQVAGTAADADFDGLSNIVEFVLGTDPRRGNDNTLTVTSTIYGIEISYLGLPGLDTGQTVGVQVSAGLVDWQDVPTEEIYDGNATPFVRHRARLETDLQQLYVRLTVSDE